MVSSLILLGCLVYSVVLFCGLEEAINEETM